MNAWLLLVGAIVMEVIGTTCMKLSDGFSRLLPSVLIFVFYGMAFIGLTLSLRRIDLAVAYAIWSGLGTVLVAFIGAAVFGESMPAVKVVSIALIVAGVVGLNLVARGT